MRKLIHSENLRLIVKIIDTKFDKVYSCQVFMNDEKGLGVMGIDLKNKGFDIVKAMRKAGEEVDWW